MFKDSLDYETKKKLIEYIGEKYQRSRKRMEICEHGNLVAENQAMYNVDQNLIFTIDRTLKDCSPDTRCIIRHVFLEKNHPDWYKSYYKSQSTFYRLRKSAVDEFLHCLDI